MFRDRREAGARLAEALEGFRDERPVVVGLPRGGVIVGAEVARALGAPLDILVVRKIGSPQQPELGIGAVVGGASPQVLLDRDMIERLGVTDDYLREETQRQIEEINRREAAYRGGRPGVPLAGRIVVIADDGVATGASIRAALRAARAMKPLRLILAVPVGAPETLRSLRDEADEVVALRAPEDFRAVGQFYQDFDQTSDEEVITALEGARERHTGGATR